MCSNVFAKCFTQGESYRASWSCVDDVVNVSPRERVIELHGAVLMILSLSFLQGVGRSSHIQKVAILNSLAFCFSLLPKMCETAELSVQTRKGLCSK